MKKNLMYAMFGAIALTGAVGLTACSSDEDVVDVNPTYNAENGTVKTQFSISFPQNVANSSTRQTAAIVQKDGTIAEFRGMDKIVLIPFGEQAVLTTGNETKIGSFIELTKLTVPTTTSFSNSIPASTTSANALVDKNNAVLFEDVTIPVGTGTFLFYGKAIDNTANTDIETADDKFKFGILKATGLTSGDQATTPSGITFTHEGVVPTDANYDKRVGIINYLNSIARAQVDDNNKWSETTNAGLKKLYDAFIKLTAGSSASVAAAVEDLYNALQANSTDLAGAIKTAINNGTYVSITERTTDTEITTYGRYKISFLNTYANYPESINLPDGAAVIKWNLSASTPGFEAAASMDYKAGGMNVATLDAYVYPANLYYWANSTIQTSNSSQKNEYTNANTTWDAVLTKYTAGASVTSASRSVAIVNPINYGVGRFDFNVALSAADLYDYHGATVNAAGGFPVTGILIGGQKAVDWQFLPNTSATEVTIYDNITKSNPGQYGATSVGENDGSALLAGAGTTGASAYNYTLALETVGGTPVNIAVEFLNTAGDFYGQGGNLIPHGTKFYLVGTLDPSNGTKPKDGNDNEININQIFKQDYYTTANITIGQAYQDTDGDGKPNKPNSDTTTTNIDNNTTGLGTATNYVPDLRQPQLELGLSINLQWNPGLKFTQTW